MKNELHATVAKAFLGLAESQKNFEQTVDRLKEHDEELRELERELLRAERDELRKRLAVPGCGEACPVAARYRKALQVIAAQWHDDDGTLVERFPGAAAVAREALGTDEP